MTNSYYAWDNVVLCVGGKEFNVKQTYRELLDICEVKWIFEIRNACPIWNIKGIGRMKLDTLEFKHEIRTLKLKCKIIHEGG